MRLASRLENLLEEEKFALAEAQELLKLLKHLAGTDVISMLLVPYIHKRTPIAKED